MPQECYQYQKRKLNSKRLSSRRGKIMEGIPPIIKLDKKNTALPFG